MDMTTDRWSETVAYLNTVFGTQDDQRATLMARAVEAGLPDIAVDASVGHLLALLVATTPGRLAIEVGTLGGYSALWLTDGLVPQGRLITIEAVDLHADFAQGEFARAGVADRVDIRRGEGLTVLEELASELAPGSVDVLFLDAIKTEYPGYIEIAMPLLADGALVIADNALGGGDWWITDEQGSHDSRDAMDAFNRQLAADPRFDTACVPIREGVLIARKRA